jgi:hypothetical protein
MLVMKRYGDSGCHSIEIAGIESVGGRREREVVVDDDDVTRSDF